MGLDWCRCVAVLLKQFLGVDCLSAFGFVALGYMPRIGQRCRVLPCMALILLYFHQHLPVPCLTLNSRPKPLSPKKSQPTTFATFGSTNLKLDLRLGGSWIIGYVWGFASAITWGWLLVIAAIRLGSPCRATPEPLSKVLDCQPQLQS